MPDTTTLRELALDMHQHADRVATACDSRPPCARCWLIVETYRSLAADFHQRALHQEEARSS